MYAVTPVVSAFTATQTSTAPITQAAPSVGASSSEQTSTPASTEGAPIAKPTSTLDLTEDDYREFYDSDFEIEGVKLAPGLSHKGLVPLKDLVSKVHPEVAKHIYNLKGHYTKGRQEIAALKQELAREKAVLKTDRENIANAYKAVQSQIEETAITDDDIWASTDGLNKHTRQQALRAVADLFKPLQEDIAAKQVASEQAQLVESAQTFIDSHSEFQDTAFRAQVTELVKAGYPLDGAYFKAMSTYESEAGKYEKQADKRSKHVDSKRALMKSGIGMNVIPRPVLKGLPAVQKVKLITDWQERTGLKY